MPSTASPAGGTTVGPVRAILMGALVVGALDITDALVFFGLRGAKPIRIFQSIAGGLLGRATYTGGIATAVMGGVLHLFIATGIVATYYGMSRKVDLLTRQAVPCGILYGVVVYGVMNLVVLPLSAAGGGGPSLPVFINGLAIHMFGVGLPSALAARWGQSRHP
jgi:hypothetical protein